MTSAFGLQDHVVLSRLDGVFLPVPGIKIGRVDGQRIPLDPINVVVQQIEAFLALVDDLDTNRFAKRNPPEAVVRVGIFHDDRFTHHLNAFAEAIGEKVAEGDFHIGPIRTIVKNSQQDLLVIRRARLGPRLRLGAEESKPHVSHHARTLRVQHDFRLAGGHA